jgi:hypothetical protein
VNGTEPGTDDDSDGDSEQNTPSEETPVEGTPVEGTPVNGQNNSTDDSPQVEINSTALETAIENETLEYREEEGVMTGLDGARTVEEGIGSILANATRQHSEAMAENETAWEPGHGFAIEYDWQALYERTGLNDNPCTAVDNEAGEVLVETNGDLFMSVSLNATGRNTTELAEAAVDHWENNDHDRETMRAQMQRLQVGATASNETSQVYIAAGIC